MTKLALNDDNTRICVWRDKEKGKKKEEEKGKREVERGKGQKVKADQS